LDPLDLPMTQSSSIEIDGMSLDSIDRTTLRARIIALSQDAIFLPEGSTFRENLDPWNAASIKEIYDVLEVIGLKNIVDGRGGLDALVKNVDLSSGQQQMFTLGRAVIRRRVRARKISEKQVPEGGILLLDEVTASVDRETENVMMSIVQREFESYTVLMVTHSIYAAMNCDRVIVLEKGEVVEEGNPRELMEEHSSRFQKLAFASHGE
jgi:ATP-binding cassette, subfamily C (CFTR/MRP), member 1